MNKITVIAGAITALSVLFLSLFYVGKKLFCWLHLLLPKLNVTLFIVIYAFFALTMIFSFSPLGFIGKSVVATIGAYWMGIFVYLLMVFVASDIIILVGKIIKVIPSPTPQRLRAISGFIVLIIVASVITYGAFNAKQVKQVSYDVKIDKQTTLKSLNIVMISDLHLGFMNNEKHLANIVLKINSLKPDIVFLLGDIFDGHYNALTNPTEVIEQFNNIISPYGVYACLGNHDAGPMYGDMLDLLEKSNINVLHDEYVSFDNRFIVVGRADSSPIGNQGDKRKEISSVLEGIDKEMPIIVLDHQPSNILEYGNEIDLILFGHTHRGQIFPGNLITNSILPVDYGYYQKEKTSPQVIVTSGVGTWGPPLRIGSNNEIASISVNFE